MGLAVRHPLPSLPTQTNSGRPAPCYPGTGAANAPNHYGHQSQHLQVTAGGTTHGPGFFNETNKLEGLGLVPLDTVTTTHLVRFSLTKGRATAVERSSCEHAGMGIMAGKGLIALALFWGWCYLIVAFY